MKDLVEKPRHPEKARRAVSETPRKPDWIRVSRADSPDYGQTRRILKDNALSTVCEEAACPNRGECWSQRHATMMIMGETCTRGCSFCNVATGRPDALDAFELARDRREVLRGDELRASLRYPLEERRQHAGDACRACGSRASVAGLPCAVDLPVDSTDLADR